MSEQLDSLRPPEEFSFASGAGNFVVRRYGRRIRPLPTGDISDLLEAAEPEPEPEEALTPELVCREYAGRIYRIALRMLGNDADVEDVTQDVLLQVVRKLDTFRGECSVSTWVHQITVNAVLALRRKRATSRERQFVDPGDGCSAEPADDGFRRRRRQGPEEQVRGQELSQLIDEAVAGLPNRFREVFVLADVEGLANADICLILGLSLPAVKSRLHRARLLLRAALTPYLSGGRGTA